jgi:hypothetical protein
MVWLIVIDTDSETFVAEGKMNHAEFLSRSHPVTRRRPSLCAVMAPAEKYRNLKVAIDEWRAKTGYVYVDGVV